MKIHKVEILGQKPKYFTDYDTSQRYLSNLIHCNFMGGNIPFTTIELDVDETGPDDIVPMFDDHEHKTIYRAEVIMQGGDTISAKVVKYHDLVPKSENRDFPHVLSLTVEHYLAQQVKAVCEGLLTDEHAIETAKSAALAKYKELKDADLIK